MCIYVAEFKFAHHLKEIHVKTIHQFEWTHESVHLSRFGGSPAGGVAGAPNPKQKTHEARMPQVLTWIMPSFFSSNMMQKISNKNQLRRHFLRKKSWFPSAKSASCIALLPWHERLIINCPFRPHVIPWSMIAIDSGFILLRPGGYLHHLKHTQAHINDSKPVFIRCYAKCQFGSIPSLLTKIGNASKIGDQNCWDAGTIHDFHEVCS